MFLNMLRKPTRLKQIIYLVAWVMLGIFLSFIFHALIEIWYLDWALKQNIFIKFYGNCALPPVLQAGIFIAGAVGGFFLGRFWWRKIYLRGGIARGRN